jgi:hypothetical protein
MDTREATQLLSWLDEERRRDKALLAEVQKALEQHDNLFSSTAQKTEDMEERLAQTKAELARMSRFDTALQQFKNEILLELQRAEKRLQKEGDERDTRLRDERQDRVKAFASLSKRIEEAFKFQEPLQAQQTEIQRLNKAILVLRPPLDEARKQAKGQEERLLILGERLNRNDDRLTELLQEREEEKARSESIKEKLTFLEGWAERGTQQMVELQAFGERLREEQAQLVGELRTVDVKREKQLAAWAKEMREWRSEVTKVGEQVALSDKQHRNAEKILSAMDTLRVQLQKDREVLQHMEQTAEERQRQQLEEWRKENEMLWLRNDEKWAQLSEENARRDDRLTLLWESQVEHLRRQVGGLAKWIREFEKRLVRSKK